MSSDGLSIVIPTFNEAENVAKLLFELGSLQPLLQRPLEVVLVDDNSPDSTGSIADALGRELGLDLRVLTRNGRRSLGGAIADGLRLCRWDLVCVMDADLSHPARLVPLLVESLDGVDGVVASRYAPGGSIESWPVFRRMVSLTATALARSLLHIRYRDPLSGFFLVRRSCLQGGRITGEGNKPLLEILVSSRPVVKEVPYRFRNRQNGESKLDAQSILDFLHLVVRLRSGLTAQSRMRPESRGEGTANRDS
ncbi:MAG: polyprenol monophosphomannose synthase [Chloroflexi bacterium]|nr:MAG: polyprenol monophosphomannose synthase [Chloroflexota bacterium]